MDVRVRRAVDADAVKVREVGLRTWPTTYAFAGQDYIEQGLATWWSPEAVNRDIAHTITFVAERDDQIIATGNLDLACEPPVIWKLYVLPEAQGTGAGHALITALLAAAPPDRGEVRLEYTDGNDRARNFYQRHGFVESHRTSGQGPDEVWMKHPLTTA